MISRISGRLVALAEGSAQVDVNGICYDVLIPSALAARLQQATPVGEPITFETLYYIEAGDMKTSHYPRLVGFTEILDREFFTLLTQVSGLGVKKALRSLVIPIRDIAAAIEAKETAALTRLPGIGARLAEKIVAELHGKTTKYALVRSGQALSGKPAPGIPLHAEAISVLLQLQYSRSEAEDLIRRVVAADPSVATVEALIQRIYRIEHDTAVAEIS